MPRELFGPRLLRRPDAPKIRGFAFGEGQVARGRGLERRFVYEGKREVRCCIRAPAMSLSRVCTCYMRRGDAE